MIADGIEAERRHQEYLREQQRKDHPKLIRQHQKTILKNLGRATYWWHQGQEIHTYLSALEHQWGAEQSEGLTEQQKERLQWARQEADALSPIAESYPDPKTDGPVDYEAIPIGGPYPKPTDLPEIPNPVPPSSESRHSENLRHEYRYPFWLKYQR
ncbi:MAG: hypothetical protein WD490_06995 [Opitutales bacterium]